MTNKPLEKIKHGLKVVEAMEDGKLFFVEDIRRATGLDERTLRGVLPRLLKNRYLFKNERGQWYKLLEE